MIMKKYFNIGSSILGVFILFFVCIWGNGQEYDKNGYVDIDGIQIGTFPTVELLEEHFGKIIKSKFINGDTNNYTEYYFDGIKVCVDKEYGLDAFDLTNVRIPFMTTYGIGKGISIGDAASVLLEGGYPIIIYKDIINYDGIREVFFYVNGSDRINHVKIKNGIIIFFSTWFNYS